MRKEFKGNQNEHTALRTYVKLNDGLIEAFDAFEKGAMTILPQTFRFRHDRIRQACYSLISDENKKSSHLKIGRLLFDNINSFFNRSSKVRYALSKITLINIVRANSH